MQAHRTIILGITGLAFAATAAAAAERPALKAPFMRVAQAPEQFTVYTGLDVAKQSYGGYSGALFAPGGGISASGFRFFLLGEAGAYKYPGDDETIKANYTGGEALVGYAVEGNNYSITLLGGANVVNHTLNAVDDENSVQGTKWGAKGRVSAWITPTDRTLIAGEGDYSTAFRSYFARGKLGYDVIDRQIFIGPEAAALGNERFNQWRVGAHVTQMKFGRLQIDLSGGFARDSVVGNGGYTSIEFSVSF